MIFSVNLLYCKFYFRFYNCSLKLSQILQLRGHTPLDPLILLRFVLAKMLPLFIISGFTDTE